jgi:hypothetical protein
MDNTKTPFHLCFLNYGKWTYDEVIYTRNYSNNRSVLIKKIFKSRTCTLCGNICRRFVSEETIDRG